MELSAQLLKAGRRMALDWMPRLQNTEADELSNFDFARFDTPGAGGPRQAQLRGPAGAAGLRERLYTELDELRA